jgi:mannan endo-1,4-beta-mannosidase
LKIFRFIFALLLGLLLSTSNIFSLADSVMIGTADTIKPVTPKASPEAAALLHYLYSISGKHILTGQHNVPLVGSTRLQGVQKMIRKYPALFGQDFGFSEPGTWDGINYRQRIVDEAILRNSEGFIITIMWHAVRPIEDEPVDFRQSIQGDITDEQWQDLITPGTSINEKWKSQVDVIAWFLKQLQYASVPVLWRPYHEMNGGWFWWGKKEGENGYKKLYRMLFDRLVNFHGLNNLIWVYDANEVKLGVDSYKTYYPGDDVVDILATDVYTEGFSEDNYDELLELAGNKPIALGEVGGFPSLDIIRSQPRWTWFMVWGDGSGRGSQGFRTFSDIYESDEAITWDELPWVMIKEPRVHYPILK